MGNRAVICWPRDGYDWENGDLAHSKELGIYVHWQGDRPWVNAWLTYCKLKNYRNPSFDDYGIARCCAVIANTFSEGLSIGIDTINKLDAINGQNAVYVCQGWSIIGRRYFTGEESDDTENLYSRLLKINSCQPVHEQLSITQICERLNKLNNCSAE